VGCLLRAGRRARATPGAAWQSGDARTWRRC
jgi:hypothetical protein